MKNRIVQTIGVGILLLGGCEKPEAIRTYKAPKDAAPKMVMRPEVETPGLIRYTIPAGWVERFGSGMTHSNLMIPTTPALSASVIVLETGDVLSNVNRWRNQVGLGPTTIEEVDKAFPAMKIAGRDSRLVDLMGEANGEHANVRMLAAIIPNAGRTWFIKVMGDAKAVESIKPTFDAFVKSVRFSGNGDAAAQGNGALDEKTNVPMNAAGQNLAGDKPVGENPASDKPVEGEKKNEAGQAVTIPGFAPVTLPAGWAMDPTPRQMRLATIVVTRGNAKAELAVSRLNANSLADKLGNVNRWRGQVKLPPTENASEHSAAEIANPQGAMTLVDIAGSEKDGDQRKRLLVGMSPVQKDGQIVFFRLLGPHDLVESQKPAMEAFLKTLKVQE